MLSKVSWSLLLLAALYMRNQDPGTQNGTCVLTACMLAWEVAEGARVHEGFFSVTFPSADSLVTKDEKPELS